MHLGQRCGARVSGIPGVAVPANVVMMPFAPLATAGAARIRDEDIAAGVDGNIRVFDRHDTGAGRRRY